MPHLKLRIRQILAFALYYSGLLWIYAAFKLRGRAVVLMYHRVLPHGADTYSHDGVIVSPATFATHMEFLGRHFRTLTPEQFGADLEGPGFGRRACLVTFDDGWQDNIQHALPVLVKHKVPAIIFVATAFVGTARTFWQERLTRLLFAAARTSSGDDEILRNLGVQRARDASDSNAKRIVRDAVTVLKNQEPVVIERILKQLQMTIGLGNPGSLELGEDRFLSWEEIRALAASELVTIGSHAHTHTPLTSMGYSRARMEFARSRQELRDHGVPLAQICAYPNGDVDDAVARAARDAGFALAFSTRHGPVRDHDDPFWLRRINVHESSSSTRAEFFCLMLGVL